MPWSSQNGGGGGGGWKGGGGPWGHGPSGGGSSGGGSPDLEEILKRSQDRLKQALPGGGMGGIFAIIALLLIGVVGYYAFFVQIQTNQVGVVLRFGEFNRQMPEGLRFRLPYPIEEVMVVDVTKQFEFEIGRRDGSTAHSFGAQSALDEGHMLTGDENIVNVNFTVKWQVKDAKNFRFSLKNPEQTIRDVAESAMREIVGQRDFYFVSISGRNEVAEAVRALTQTILDKYNAGILIVRIELPTAEPPREVVDAFRDVQAARADQDRLQNEAEAERNTKIPNARGEAVKIREGAEAFKTKVIADAQGQTARFEKVYEQYSKAPEVTRKRIYLDTMEAVLGGSNKIIIDEKGSGVVPYLPLPELNRSRGAQ